eukprot:gene27058-34951_t
MAAATATATAPATATAASTVALPAMEEILSMAKEHSDRVAERDERLKEQQRRFEERTKEHDPKVAHRFVHPRERDAQRIAQREEAFRHAELGNRIRKGNDDDEGRRGENDEDDDDPRATPKLFTIPNDHRYRTEHGSHTVAANGGCLRDEKYKDKGMRCALHYEAIVQYQSMDEHRSQPRSLRLMRVLLESIEDLYLLSQCDALIAQGSSHFSTLAALLIWARTLGYDTFQPTSFTPLTSSPSTPEYLLRVHFLDQDGIRAGFTPTGFLHGMNLLNGTVGVDTRSVDSGIRRWQVHTAGFQTALPAAAHLTW